jgi:hypothetical protein
LVKRKTEKYLRCLCYPFGDKAWVVCMYDELVVPPVTTNTINRALGLKIFKQSRQNVLNEIWLFVKVARLKINWSYAIVYTCALLSEFDLLQLRQFATDRCATQSIESIIYVAVIWVEFAIPVMWQNDVQPSFIHSRNLREGFVELRLARLARNFWSNIISYIHANSPKYHRDSLK